MSNTETGRFFSLIQRIVFVEIGDKLRPGSLKNVMALLFVIFEKIGTNFEIISKNYIKLYYDVVKEEIKLANITSDDRVLVIGCGPIPSTSIILAKETNIQIVALDNDLKAVAKASQYVKNYTLQDKIKIHFSDGAKYPVKDFDVIFVLYGVKQQPQLLKYLSENISKNERVVYRAQNDVQSKRKEYENQLSKLFQVKKIVRTNSFGSMDSFLLLKKATE